MTNDQIPIEATGIVVDHGVLIIYQETIIVLILAAGTWATVIKEDV